MTCCTHRCNQGRACTARRRLINVTRAAMAAASWLALAVPHGGA